jgi:prepilin-type N-terminal cleavage/methylation domain-containing protein
MDPDGTSINVRTQRGFTIAEFMAALAISSIVTMVLASTFGDMVKHFMAIQRKSELIQDGIIVGDVFSKEIEEVNGGIQPMAFMVHVDNACDAATPLPSCPKPRWPKNRSPYDSGL